MNNPIIPIILSGGTGSRLWPISRPSRPKQFLRFGGPHSLLQQTVLRCEGPAFAARPILVGGNEQRFMMAEDLREIGVDADVLLEPVARDSCAAFASGCLQAIARDRHALVLLLPTDHHFADQQAFSLSVASAVPLADAGKLVIFGIKPHRPSTGFGYVAKGAPVANANAFAVGKFSEKPDEQTAAALIEAGALWNSGMLLCKAEVFLAELEKCEPRIPGPVRAAFAAGKRDLDFIRLGESELAQAPAISLDRAVLEKTDAAVIVPLTGGWADVATWSSVWEVGEHDAQGNAVHGRSEFLAARDNLVYSPLQLTALVGVSDLVVVSTRDAVLVASKDRSEEIGDLVAKLKASGHAEATEALRMFRPWGNYERLDMDTSYQVKRIVVNPGGVLSLQKHRHRSEHWVVVQGEAEVTLDGEVSMLRPNESVYVPLGSVHRLANRGDMPVVLIEVQTGTYFGEDDIIRLEDTYNRAGNTEK